MAGWRFLSNAYSDTLASVTSTPSADASFPAANAIGTKGQSRYTPWRTGNTPAATENYDIDLTLTRDITLAAVLGFRRKSATAANPTSADLYHGTSSSGPWTSVDTMALGSLTRDVGVAFTTISKRHWRFQFVGGGSAYSVGRILLGDYIDMGQTSRGGRREEVFRPQGALIGPGGHPFTFESPDLGRVFTLRFENVTTSKLATFQDVIYRTGPIVMLDPGGNCYQARIPAGSRPSVNYLWDDGTTKIYDLSITLEQFP